MNIPIEVLYNRKVYLWDDGEVEEEKEKFRQERECLENRAKACAETVNASKRTIETGTGNDGLASARAAKNDEFYTLPKDIEDELAHYKESLRGKVVYCNCDSVRSEFWRILHKNFSLYGLKKLICTNFVDFWEATDNNRARKAVYTGGNDENIESCELTDLLGTGDFRSEECENILKEADVIITNPPFSLFREYVSQLIRNKKEFLVLGGVNAITYKDFFPYLKRGEVWLGYGCPTDFITPDGGIRKVITRWYTNLENDKHKTEFELEKPYNKDEYTPFSNYDAINIDNIKDIPVDYYPCWYTCPNASTCEYITMNRTKSREFDCDKKCSGEMGVPITFMDRYCPEQFELVGHEHDINGNGGDGVAEGAFEVETDDGKKKQVFKRVIIRRTDEQRSYC